MRCEAFLTIFSRLARSINNVQSTLSLASVRAIGPIMLAYSFFHAWTRRQCDVHICMKSTSQHVLCLAHPTAGPVSRARKQFNTLIKKLEAARSLIATWKETFPLAKTIADRDDLPLMDIYDERLKQLVLLLDEMHGHKLLGKRERDKLSKFIAAAAIDLLSRCGTAAQDGIDATGECRLCRQ